MTNIAVKILELEEATTFKEIFDVYIEALEVPHHIYNYEKACARDALRNLAEFLDTSPFVRINVKKWGELNREKHGAGDE